MIATVDDIRTQIRQITKNIQDIRVEPYIFETETIDVVEVLGAELYEKIDKQLATGVGDLDADVIKMVKEGGYYTDKCSKRQFTQSLKMAISYLAYARFLHANSVNATAFGVTQKISEFSQPSQSKDISKAANNAERIGINFLNNFVKYLKSVGVIKCKTKHSARQKVVRRIKYN